MSDYRYRDAEDRAVSREALGDAERETQLDVMRTWFYQNYEDPAERTPYESAEGGYIWIWGGPFDAREELEEEFGGIVDEEVIEELVDELQGECHEWAPTPKPGDYDRYIVDDIIGITDHYENFSQALINVEKLLDADIDDRLLVVFHRLLYVNVITAMETYLSDAFIKKVVPDKDLVRRFVETTPDFKAEKIPLADVYKASEQIEERAKTYLADLVWHRLDRIGPMYKETLDVSFPKEMNSLYKAIVKRHDIVHRNGKSKGGEEVRVSRDDIETLITEVATFVKDIDSQVGNSRVDLNFSGGSQL